MSESAMYATAAIILGFAGLVILIVALFRDRSRGRRRCPKCWYDLSGSGNENLRCSECGHVARRERKLYKTRRHWRWAGFAIVLLLGALAVHYTPKVKRDGWWAIVPTTVLILGLPRYASRSSDTYRELERRMPAPFLVAGSKPPGWWHWQWRLLINQCLDGDPRRTPPSVEWYYYYGLCLDHALTNGCLLDDPAIRTRLAETFPMKVTIEPINQVAVGHSLHCRMKVRGGTGRSVIYRVTAVADLPEQRTIEAEWFSNDIGSDFGFVGIVTDGISSVNFDLSVFCRPAGSDGPWLPYQQLNYVMPIDAKPASTDS